MNMLKVAITLLAILVQLIGASSYNCTFGPDDRGHYMIEIVDSRAAMSCGDFCSCVGLTNNICHFGPDDKG